MSEHFSQQAPHGEPSGNPPSRPRELPADARWLTEAQVATMTQVTTRTIRRWACAGRFPKGVPIGDHPKAKRRWVRAEVEQWMRDKEAQDRS